MSRAGGQMDIEPEAGPQEKTKEKFRIQPAGVFCWLFCFGAAAEKIPTGLSRLLPPSLQTRRLKTGIICCMIGKDEIRREADGP